MKIDITLKIAPKLMKDHEANVNKSLVGHLGTHFDVMDKEFPLEYTQRRGIVFDVASIRGRDIEAADIDLEKVEADMFVAFRTGFIGEEPYGTVRYFKEHPQLSQNLIDTLLAKKISVIALDCAGVRRGSEHTPADQRCADVGVFVIENLCNLEKVLANGGRFTSHTYPMRDEGITGLPCRVIAEV